MIRKFACAAAATLLTAFLAAPANAGHFKLGILSCDIGGRTGYVIASNKGLSCTFKPSGGAAGKPIPALFPSSASTLASRTRARSNGRFWPQQRL